MTETPAPTSTDYYFHSETSTTTTEPPNWDKCNEIAALFDSTDIDFK